MKKLFAFCLALLLPLTAARADDVLRVRSNVPEGFVTDLRVEADSSYIESDQLMRQLRSGAPGFDAFAMLSADTNVAGVIDEGYCLDLSSSEVIRDALSRMHPAISSFLSRGEAIYGIPSSVGFADQTMCNEEVWRELGYTEADVPQSFPELLDFLERWVVRNEINHLDVRLKNTWDETLYNEHTYASWLVDMLMRSWIQQAQYTGGELRFNTPELVALLERSRTVGEQITRYCEQPGSVTRRQRALFVTNDPFHGGWTEMETWMIHTRLTADQPDLLLGDAWVKAVYAGTEHPEEAIRLMEAMLLAEEMSIDAHLKVFLYADAEPLPNPSQAGDLRADRNRIALIEHRLAGDETPIETYLELQDSDYERPKYYDEYTPFLGYQGMMERLRGMTDDEARQELDDAQRRLAEDEANAWAFSPEDLATYKRLAQDMVIEEPTVFQANDAARSSYYDLVKQYGNGQISTEELVTKLDDIVETVMSTNQ